MEPRHDWWETITYLDGRVSRELVQQRTRSDMRADADALAASGVVAQVEQYRA